MERKHHVDFNPSSPHLRKDRYNKKLMKYYVIYGEDDEDISENEEVHQHQESGEASCMNKKTLKPCPHTR